MACNDSARATEAWRRVAAIAPADAEAWAMLGSSLFNAGRAQEATEATARAIELEPEQSTYHILYGFALRALGSDDAADRAFETAYAIDPKNPDGARGMGQALIRRRAGRELAAHCEKCVELVGPRAWIVAQYLVALSLLGRSDEVAGLLDYESLMRVKTIRTPQGFSSLDEFNQALRAELYALDPVAGGTEPLDVLHEGFRVPDGPQSAVKMFGAEGAPASFALLNAFRAECEDYEKWLAATGDSLHLRMKPGASTLRADALITSRQGYLSPHTHAGTWTTAVYYAVVPDGEDGPEKAGCLEFAPPLHKVTLPEGIWPSFVLRPSAGLIALFPAYFYHHVHPTEATGERIVVTFDVQPAKGSHVTGISLHSWLDGVGQE